MFASPVIRPDVMTLLAFNVEIARIRETVSEPLIGQMRLQWWRDVIEKLADGQGPPLGHPVAECVAALIQARTLDTRAFSGLVDAREADMSDDPCQTLDELIMYCSGTSGDLHRLMVSLVEDCREADTHAAHAVGVAWALIGILRATPLLAAVNRTRLPQDLLNAEGLSVQDLQKPETANGVRPIAKAIARAASVFLAEARTQKPGVSRQSRSLLLHAIQAERYLSALQRASYDLYHPAFAQARPSIIHLWWNAWRQSY